MKNIKNDRMKQVDAVMEKAETASLPQIDKTEARMAAVDREMMKAEETTREMQIQELNAEAEKKEKAIGEKEIAKALGILQDYKTGKQMHDDRVVENEKWYNNRIAPPATQKGIKKMFQSSWLFNVLVNKHADFMDNYPEATILPREISDKKAATMLTSIVNVVCERNKFKRTFDKNCWRKECYGTSAYGVFWDGKLLNGLGDIKIQKTNTLNMFWEPGTEYIQDSPNLFIISTENNDTLISQYPELQDKLGAVAGGETREFETEDADTKKDKSNVYEWYYKKTDASGRTVVHYVKFCANTVLYATENETQTLSDGHGNVVMEAPAVTGLYNHGKYPFVLDVLFPVEGAPTGVGWIDKLKDAQMQIDILNNAMIVNAKQSAMKRWIVPKGTKLNMKQFGDWTNPLVETTDGKFNENTAVELTTAPMSDTVIAVLDRKIDELKETGSNRDFANGSTSSGVTSGAAIAALQEAGNKTSRDMISGSYDAFEEIVELIIELIRQFYTTKRCFRITGEDGSTEYVEFDNSSITPGGIDGNDNPIGDRMPYFDVKIKAHKQNPFSRVAQNQDVLNMYSMGLFNPANADQSLACVDLLEIEGKEKMKEKIEQNGTLLDMVQKMQPLLATMAMELDAIKGTTYTQELAGTGMLGDIGTGITGTQPQAMSGKATNPLGELNRGSGHATVDSAKQRVAAATELK